MNFRGGLKNGRAGRRSPSQIWPPHSHANEIFVDYKWTSGTEILWLYVAFMWKAAYLSIFSGDWLPIRDPWLRPTAWRWKFRTATTDLSVMLRCGVSDMRPALPLPHSPILHSTNVVLFHWMWLKYKLFLTCRQQNLRTDCYSFWCIGRQFLVSLSLIYPQNSPIKIAVSRIFFKYDVQLCR